MYLLEFFGFYGKKVLWEAVHNNVVEEENYHEEIGLWGFYFIFLVKTRRELVKKG